MSPLVKIIYVSEINAAVLTTSLLDEIKIQASRNNPANEITGLLAFDHAHFIQWLEGPRDAVNKLLLAIMRDNRHGNLQVVECNELQNRLFGCWSMAYYPLVEGDLESEEDRVADLDAEQCNSLFMRLSTRLLSLG